MFSRIRVRRALSIGVWGAIAYYFFAVLGQIDWDVVVSRDLRWSLVIAALVTGIISRFFLPVIRTILLSALEGKTMSVAVLMWPYAVSWIGRYLPGKIGLIGTRLLAADRYGYSKVGAVLSGGVEVVLQVILSTTLSLGLLMVALRSTLPFHAVPIAAMVTALAVLISPPVLRSLVNMFVRWQKQSAASVEHLSWGIVLGCATLFLLMYGMQSVYTILLAEGIDVSVHDRWLAFLGAMFLSSVAGMVALFSPNGIGVRELAFVELLGPWYSREQLVSFVICWRLAEVLVDASFFLLAWRLRREHAPA